MPLKSNIGILIPYIRHLLFTDVRQFHITIYVHYVTHAFSIKASVPSKTNARHIFRYVSLAQDCWPVAT